MEPTTVHAPGGSRRFWHSFWFRVLTRPTVANYRKLVMESEMPLRRSLWRIGRASFIAGVLSWIASYGLIQFDTATGNVSWTVGMDFSVLIGGVLSFVLTLALLRVLAVALGGSGSFTRLSQVASVYCAMLVLAGGIASGIEASLIAPAAPMRYGMWWTGGLQPTGLLLVGANTLLTAIRLVYDGAALQAVYGLSRTEAMPAATTVGALTVCAGGGAMLTAYLH